MIKIRLRFLAIFLFIFIWQLIGELATNPFLKTPTAIVKTVATTVTWNWIAFNLVASLITLVLGFTCGTSFGIMIGVALGSSKFSADLFLPIANFIRSIPGVAKISVIMAIFGLGLNSRIFSVALAAFFPLLLTTIDALRSTKVNYTDLTKIQKLNKRDALFSVSLPAASGQIISGMQLALQLSILVTVVSEMLGSGQGIGAFIMLSQATFDIENIWVGIFIVGFIGVLSNYFLIRLEHLLLPWYFKETRSKA